MARNREPQIFNISFLDVICGALGAVIFLFIAVPKGGAPPGRSNQLNVSIDTTHKQLFATLSDSLAAKRPGDTLLVVLTGYKPMPGIAECPDCPTCPEPQPVADIESAKITEQKRESAQKDSAPVAASKPAETPPPPPDNFKRSKYEGDPPSVPCKVSIEINWADIGDNVDIFVCKGNKCVSGGAREIRDIGQWDSGKAKTKFFGSDLRTTQEAVRQFDKIQPGEYKVYALFKESAKNNGSVRIRGLVYSRNDQGEEKGEPFGATLQLKAPRVLIGTVQMPEDGAFQFTKN
jgi:hypothetical protein